MDQDASTADPGEIRKRFEGDPEEYGRTFVRPPVALFLSISLALSVLAVPLTDLLFAGPDQRSALFSAFERFGAALASPLGDHPDDPLRANAKLRQEMNLFEEALAEHSVTRALLPTVQSAMLPLGLGNESVYLGRGDWLYLEEAVDHLLRPGFLEPEEMMRRLRTDTAWSPALQPDPVVAIVDLQRRLALHDVELLFVPIPVKAAIHPEPLGGRAGTEAPLRNPSFEEFLARLARAGVAVIDLAPLFRAEAARGREMYLPSDTHWRPEVVELAAAEIARALRERIDLPPVADPGYRRQAGTLMHPGDLVRLLQLPNGEERYPPVALQANPVVEASGEPWSPEKAADILLVGDSFTNIYSRFAGSPVAAGLAAQLSYELRRPIDRFALDGNDERRLWRELNRSASPERLENKRVLIWEITARRLSKANWPRMRIGQNAALGDPDAPR